MSWDTNQQLVQDRRNEEDDDLCKCRWYPSTDKRTIDMSSHEVGDGLVPRSPVFPDAANVPPWPVELTVGKAHDLGKAVHRRLEERKETTEPTEQRHSGQLHDALHNGDKVEAGHLVERVLQQGCGILSGCDPDGDAETEYFQSTHCNVPPADSVGAWIGRLVYKRWGPPEVAEV